MIAWVAYNAPPIKLTGLIVVPCDVYFFFSLDECFLYAFIEGIEWYYIVFTIFLLFLNTHTNSRDFYRFVVLILISVSYI